MAAPTLLSGNRFRLYKNTTGSTYVFVCLASTLSLTYTNDFEDATVPDCATPLSIPQRQSVLRSQGWSLSFSGSVDATQLTTLRADVASETAVKYQIQVDKLLAAGGGTWTGFIFFESLVVSKTNNGIVTFTATCRGDAALVWADALA